MVLTVEGGHALFARYLDICNAALEEHGDELPYEQLLELGKLVVGRATIGVFIYDHDPNRPVAAYTVRFQDGRLEPISIGIQQVEWTWDLPLKHVEQVVNEPIDYLHDPSLLDWSWVQAELGTY